MELLHILKDLKGSASDSVKQLLEGKYTSSKALSLASSLSSDTSNYENMKAAGRIFYMIPLVYAVVIY